MRDDPSYASLSVYVSELIEANGYIVKVHMEPGERGWIDATATKGEEHHAVRAHFTGKGDTTYLALCQLATSCGIDLE